MTRPSSLTQQQLRCMRLIQDCVDRTGGVAPSVSELQEGLGLSSKSGVARLLDGLTDRGYIERDFARARAIRILHRLPPRENAVALDHLATVLAAAVPSLDGIVRISLPADLALAALAALAPKAA